MMLWKIVAFVLLVASTVAAQPRPTPPRPHPEIIRSFGPPPPRPTPTVVPVPDAGWNPQTRKCQEIKDDKFVGPDLESRFCVSAAQPVLPTPTP
jgi:hypothetical protein